MFSIQPILENSEILLQPLAESDFQRLYEVASDAEIWAQHPNKDRHKEDVFRIFFDGARISGGAFIIFDKKSGDVAGSSRFYGLDDDENSIFIGYTFFAKKFWGTGLNPQVKKLMLNYIFQHVDLVKFHVGAENWRSRKAMERLGAKFKGEIEVAYHGEKEKTNVEYWIHKKDWKNSQD